MTSFPQSFPQFTPPLMSALLRVLAAVAVLLIAASVRAEFVSSKLRIAQIIARAQGWVAGDNAAFEGKTLEDVISLLARSSSAASASEIEAEPEDAVEEATASTSAASLIQISSQQQHADDDLPAEFDPRVSHSACLAGVFFTRAAAARAGRWPRCTRGQTARALPLSVQQSLESFRTI